MKAVTWHGKRDVRVDNVPDPVIQQPTDAIVRITTTNICGSGLHLYEVLGLATHRLPLSEAPLGYKAFQEKKGGAIKVLLTP